MVGNVKVSWLDAKNLFEREAVFPDKVGLETHKLGEYHVMGNSNHSLEHYSWEGFFYGWPVDYYYTFCTECKKVWWKKAVIMNNDTNTCYQKWFMKVGEETTPTL